MREEGEETHDLISNIMPNIRNKLDLPLALPAYHPLQVGVAGPAFAIDPSILQLGEMAFEEADLVLICGAWDIGGRALDRKVIINRALVNGGLSLWNQFSPPHVRVPFRGVINRDLCALG